MDAYVDKCYNVVPFAFGCCGEKMNKNIDIKSQQQVDRTISMLVIDGSLESLEVGQRASYYITNDILYFDKFWTAALEATIVMGLIIYVAGFVCETRSSGKRNKYTAVKDGLVILYDHVNDWSFILLT